MSASPLPQRFSVTEQTRDDGATVVVVVGELDLATAGQLQESLDALAAAMTRTVLDLSSVSFLDSTGLKVIIKAARDRERTGWAFVVASQVSQPVGRLFELVEAHTILPFEDL
jgi:anti-anti-sigma factor